MHILPCIINRFIKMVQLFPPLCNKATVAQKGELKCTQSSGMPNFKSVKQKRNNGVMASVFLLSVYYGILLIEPCPVVTGSSKDIRIKVSLHKELCEP